MNTNIIISNDNVINDILSFTNNYTIEDIRKKLINIINKTNNIVFTNKLQNNKLQNNKLQNNKFDKILCDLINTNFNNISNITLSKNVLNNCDNVYMLDINDFFVNLYIFTYNLSNINNFNYNKNDYVNIKELEKTFNLIEEKKIYLDLRGNCVDKFIRDLLENNINNLQKNLFDLKNNIANRTIVMTQIGNYHDSSTYEYDLNKLFNIKNISQQINNNITKFIEQLTDIEYTKI